VPQTTTLPCAHVVVPAFEISRTWYVFIELHVVTSQDTITEQPSLRDARFHETSIQILTTVIAYAALMNYGFQL
jgi:hypothetical protein